MLERLADHDDALMEDLISEIEPPKDRVFEDLAKELRERQVVPVMIGSAERGNGVTRLLKALDRKSTRLNSSHANISYAVFCLKKKKNKRLYSSLQKKQHPT